MNLVAARPELAAGLTVEREDGGACSSRRANGRVELQTELLRPCLPGFFTAAISEHDPIGDHDGLASVHVARHPGRRQLQRAPHLIQPEGGDAAA
jgi:hypothetical protein